MAKVIVGIGLPGSGKTTVLKEFAVRHGYAYLCPDDIRQELTGNPADQSRNREVWHEAYRRTADLLERGETVVFDASFVKFDERKDFLTFARESGAEKVEGVFLDVPLEIAKERNEARERRVPGYAIDRMERNLRESLPGIEDGFDAIFTLNEEQKLTHVEMRGEEETLRREFGKLR